ncbi:peptidoglycan synthetase [Marinilabiliaceae bacterium JC017]|nr:peptidoglycan synthetase [Marinilabiliaceae bacterium JC017]
MRVHFIAIGGSAMHNLAIALKEKGYQVTGSDDQVFEPSRSRLQAHGLLPKTEGWHPENITPELDAIILGMHARKDNPELAKALSLGLKVYSYPEYLYDQCKNKKRVVIGGSHGKTTITSMVMHVLKTLGIDFDYMVGALLDGFDTMVRLTPDAPIAVFEGDEYLSSPLDLTPKFHWYKPDVALLSGIAWDHVNVFPTWENYVSQFEKFATMIQPGGALIYYANDPELQKIANKPNDGIAVFPYDTFPSAVENGVTVLHHNGKDFPMQVFGDHNLQNINGARLVCNQLGISDADFLDAMTSFAGASKRLQLLAASDQTNVYLDFAHSPSKLQATTKAVKKQFPDKELVACMELHTFSSLNKDFLPQYAGCMEKADHAFVYFNPAVVAHKKLQPISAEDVYTAFNQTGLEVFTSSEAMLERLKSLSWEKRNLLIMTSGNFSGVDIPHLAREITQME